MTVRTVSGPLEEPERLRAVFDGTLLVFRAVDPMADLCAYVDALVRESFGADPEGAQFGMDPQEYVDRVQDVQRRFRTEQRPKVLLRSALEAVGVDPWRSHWDRPYLRVAPHGDDHRDRRTQPLGFHRDTWASNVYSQTNWWAPVYPVTPGRAIAFYPQYWHQPLANTSAAWDLEEVVAGRVTSVTPEPAAPVQTSSEVRVVVEPGDLLCFSGAHLHASVPNSTGRARFSVEVRTADAECEAAGRGAPNLDGEAPHTATRWFRRLADDLPLREDLAGRAVAPAWRAVRDQVHDRN